MQDKFLRFLHRLKHKIERCSQLIEISPSVLESNGNCNLENKLSQQFSQRKIQKYLIFKILLIVCSLQR